MAKKSNTLPEDPRLEELRKVAAEHGGKWTLLNEDGVMVIPPIYDFIGAPDNGICLISKDGKYGFIRPDGTLLVEPTYEKATSFGNGRASVKVDGKWGIIDESGKTIVAPQYEDSTYFREGLAVVKQNGKYGYIDLEGNVVVPPTYEYASSFDNGLGIVKLNGKCGVINTKGEIVIAPTLEAIQQSAILDIWQYGMTVATSDGAKGIINTLGEWVLPPNYANVQLYFQPAFSQQVGDEVIGQIKTEPGGNGRVSQNGRIVAPPIFKELKEYNEGLAAAQDASGKWGYIDLNGEWAIAPTYDSVGDFTGALARVVINKRRFVINRENKEVADNYKTLRSANGTVVDIIPMRYIVERGGKWGLIDDELKEILSAEFDDIERWGDSQLAKVTKDSKEGLIDIEGNEILPIKYESIDSIWNGKPLASVRETWHEKAGAVNAEGKWIVPPVYSRCNIYEEAGIVEVEKDGLKGLLDLEGNEILPCVLDYIGSFKNDMTAASKEGKYGVLSNKGEWIIRPEFDGIELLSEGLAAARKDDKWGFVNQEGKWIIEPTWDRIMSDCFKGGVAIARDDSSKYVIIDKTGKALTKPSSNVRLYDIKDGMRRMQVGRKYGFLTEDGKIAIKPTFDEADDFENGWAQVSLKVDKQPVWTFIDREGRYGHLYKEKVSLWGNPVQVKEDEKIAILHPDSTMATPFIFSRVDKAVEGFAPAKIAGF